MSTPDKVHIFTEFTFYLRLLNAFDFKQFHQNNWRQNLRSAFFALGATAIIVLPPVSVLLDIWYLIEQKSDVKTCVVAVPMLSSIVNVHFTFIVLLMNKRVLFETIGRIQGLVNQGEFSFYFGKI